MQAEFEYLKSEALKWVEKIRTSRLPRDLVWTAMRTGITRKLFYPLAATTLTEEQCNEIMRPVLEIALPKSALNRHFPRVLLYASYSAGGIQLPNMFIEQGLQHLKRLTQFTHLSQTITGHLLATSIECLAMELGCAGNPFLQPADILHMCAADTWIKHIWMFCFRFRIQVEYELEAVYPQREGDQTTMQKFIQAGYKNPFWLAAVNKCRLYQQVVRVSDIVSANGKLLDYNSYHGYVRMASHDRFPHKWPVQGKPAPADWTCWRQGLSEVFGLIGPSRRLVRPLGRWQSPWFYWRYFLARSGQVLIKQEDSSFQVLVHRQQDLYVEEELTFWTWAEVWFYALPLQRVELVAIDQGFLVSNVDEQRITRAEIEGTSLRVPQYQRQTYQYNNVRQRVAWSFQLEFEAATNKAILNLAHKLTSPGIRAVSDGSPKEGKGAAAWIIVMDTPEGEFLEVSVSLSGGFRVPGPAEIQDSYRCELAGLLAILSVVRAVIRKFHLPDTHILIACDGKGALHRLFLQEKQASMMDSQWDLVVAAQVLMESMPGLEIQWRHVKGHQDEVEYAQLDEWTELNIRMDYAAKQARCGLMTAQQFPQDPRIPRLSIEGQLVATASMERLREHCLNPEAMEYWQKHGQLGDAALKDIAWPELGTALKEMASYRRRFVTKHMSGWCGVAKNFKKWKFSGSDECPRCRFRPEAAEHVWRCPEESATTLWQHKMQGLDEWLAEFGTAPQLQQVIVENFSAWRAGARRPVTSSSLPGLQAAVQLQNSIGWRGAFEGRWASEFITVQQRYYQFVGKRNTGKRWLIAIIKKTRDIAWDMWQHRNRVQEKVREEQRRAELKVRVIQIFEEGIRGIHPASIRILTHKTLEQRLAQRTNDMEAWVLRAEAAQERATRDPERVFAAAAARQARARQLEWRRQRQMVMAVAQRALQRQAAFMRRWIESENKSENE